MTDHTHSLESDQHTLRGALLESLTKLYKKLQITDVELYDDLDADGDKVVRVYVFFRADDQTVASQSLVSAIRNVRNILIHSGKTEFPLLSFISAKERNSTVEAL